MAAAIVDGTSRQRSGDSHREAVGRISRTPELLQRAGSYAMRRERRSCGNRPEHPANSQFTQQTTALRAFASVSNAAIGVPRTAESSSAVHNLKPRGTSACQLPFESRTGLVACWRLLSQMADNASHVFHHTVRSEARPGRVRFLQVECCESEC